MEEKVEVIEWYEGCKMVRKTVNGFDVPAHLLDLHPTIAIQRITLTKREAEEIYGKHMKLND